MAPDEAAPRPSGSKRMKKREMERLRKQQMKLWLTVAALAVAASAVGAVIVFTPPAAPPHNLKPGEILNNNPMHIHPRLTIIADGNQRTIPGNIGIQGGIYADHSLDQWLDTREGEEGTLAPIHTHDSSGIIHVEARVTRGFTLGEFFSIWGQPCSSDRVLDYVADAHHTLTLTVDGRANSEWQDLVFYDNENIVITFTTV